MYNPVDSKSHFEYQELAAHFRKSGSRTKKLKTIAAVNNFKRPLRYPAYFEVRYFQATTFSPLMNQWLVVDKLHFITFLIDVQKQHDLFTRLESCKYGELEGG